MIEENLRTNVAEFSGLKYKINQLACIGICVYMTLPYSRNLINLYGLIFIVAIWLITTDIKWLITKMPKDIIFVAVFFATFIPYAIAGKLGYGIFDVKTLTVAVPMFFLGYFINHYYMYYKKDSNTLGKIALVSFISYIIGSYQTYSGLVRYPSASRGLAGGTYAENPEIVNLYKSLGIGGFSYVYAGCFIFLGALFFLTKVVSKENGKYKIICSISLVLMALMILKASYAAAILITFFGIILIFIVKKRSTLVAFMIFAGLFLLLFPQNLIGEFLLKVSSLFVENQTLYKRFTEVALSFFPDSGGLGSLGRAELYIASLKTFIAHPLFGIYGPFGGGKDPMSYSVIGGHSGWLDLLGFYGLFAGIPLFLSIYFNIKKHLKYFMDEKYFGFMISASFLFVIFGVINPNISIFEIGFAQFCILPAIPFLTSAFVPNLDDQGKLEPK